MLFLARASENSEVWPKQSVAQLLSGVYSGPVHYCITYLGSAVSVRIIETGFRCRLGEGPTWIPRLNAMLWVDILGPKIHCLNLESGSVSSFSFAEPIGWIVERAGRDDFLIGLKSGVAEFDMTTGSTKVLLELETDKPNNRLNDAKVDPAGTLWAGTKDDTDQTASGTLYRIDPHLRVTVIDEGYGVTNGPTFSPDGKVMYHADSAARTVYAFDLGEDGSVSRRRKWLRFDDDWGYPDGMTTDSEGCVWIAHWDGGRVSRFSPDGKLVSSIHLPASNITSCAFGGVDLDRMFVTSSMLQHDDEAAAGMLFELSPGVQGLNPTSFAG